MKKVTFLAIAFAAMAFAMTSCNKEQNIPADLQGTLEENEILNAAKDHLNGQSIVFNANDLAVFVNGYTGAANYRANSNSDNPTWRFVSKYNNQGSDFDATASLRFYYPQTATWQSARKIKIANSRTCTNGRFGTMPMYGEGTNGNITYRNVLGAIRFNITSDRPIDKIVVNSQANYLSGVFSINMNSGAPVITVTNDNLTGAYAKGKTLTLNMTAPVNNPTAYMFMPPAAYATGDLTFKFYSGDAYVQISNPAELTVSRTQFLPINVDLTNKTWVE